MKITRFRGDTYPEEITLNVNALPINLDSLSEIQLTIRKTSGVVTLEGVKSPDPLTGEVIFNFPPEVGEDVGVFFYDIQAIGIDDIKATFVKDKITFQNDINKT